MRATRVLSSSACILPGHALPIVRMSVRILIQLVDAIALCPALTAGDRQMGDLQISPHTHTHTHTHTQKLQTPVPIFLDAGEAPKPYAPLFESE
jgi:hypothetical protein